MELIEGGLDRLKDEFSEVFCDGEHGIFVIGIDRSDPGFTEGCAVLFRGDDGWFVRSSPRINASVLPELAHVL